MAIGGFFSAESMFHRVTDASKVAIVGLVDRLREGGFELIDIQFLTAHTARLGGIEIPKTEYLRRLAAALKRGDGSALDDQLPIFGFTG